MAYTVMLEVSVTVDTEEQANKLFMAAMDGTAEAALKEKILFPERKVVENIMTAINNTTPTSSVAEEKQQEAAIAIKPVATKGTKKGVSLTEEKKERSTGIFGRKRLERSGGK